jgi:hypothetical protein
VFVRGFDATNIQTTAQPMKWTSITGEDDECRTDNSISIGSRRLLRDGFDRSGSGND